jgi:hypothetical protein
MGSHDKQAAGLAKTIAAVIGTEPTLAPGASVSGMGTDPTVASLAGGHAPAAPPPKAGSARFVPGALLGQGGMGRVHEAEDLQFGRQVALKTLLVDDAELARRFAVEALVTANLEHPGIPAVYERGVLDGKPFYAMRKASGRPLSDAIDAARTHDARLALTPVVVQVANTLGYAHSRGVIHRDVKPDNVLVGEHGEVMVVDWGIAKVRGTPDWASLARAPRADGAEKSDAKQTAHGSVLGTPAYMAPEQARGDVAAIDERTDVFALGAMLYHVLAGHPPYEGSSTAAALAQAMEGKARPLRDRAPWAPAAMIEIAERAMATDPAARFADAHAFAEALGGSMTRSLAQPRSKVGRWAAAAVSVATVFVALIGTLGLLEVSSFREQGWPAWVIAFLSVAGVGSTIADGVTRGRYHLAPLGVGIAVATMLGGIAGTATGFEVALHFIRQMPASEQPPTLLQAAYEILRLLATSAQLTLMQVVALAIVARLRSLREADAESAGEPVSSSTIRTRRSRD